MLIKSITLNNYRLYKGKNTISFDFNEKKNVFLISGENGFGKTTFLHSLLWCLYGRLASDVDVSLKKEIQNGGYSSLLSNNLNNSLKNELTNIPGETISKIKRGGYDIETANIRDMSEYYVEIVFSEVVIPSIPCATLSIRRSYDYILDKEDVTILIDGNKNELTNEIGPEVFINDFILNKDIARFFFFDSEQIVSLAETNSSAERKRLCSAYNEVLGVRKYEDLRNNLDNIRVRFRKRSNDVVMKNKLESLIENSEQLKKDIDSIKNRISEIDSEKIRLIGINEEYQLKLAREGNGATIEEITRLQEVVKATQKKDIEYKQLLKSYLEYAPLAICGSLLVETRNRVETDHKIYSANISETSRNEIISNITSELFLMLHKIGIDEVMRMDLQDRMQTILAKYRGSQNNGTALLDVPDSDFREFESIYNYITSTYKAEFERLADDYKKNKQVWDRSSRRLSIIESKESDELIQKIRNAKNEIEAELSNLDSELRILLETVGTKNQEYSILQKQISETIKKVDINDIDAKKDKLSQELSAELSLFLTELKKEKKFSLERRIKIILNELMHKDDFIHHVEVSIINDDMDIDLYSADGSKINKESLSKGEQQLYATALLKALVEESGIKFPVFIDSPLQKFDKTHAAKIITEFYPSISSQVVLFPLLYKELTYSELELMKPFINGSYLIKNNVSRSYFEVCNINSLMSEVYV